MKYLFLLLIIVSTSSFAEEKSQKSELEKKLESLNIPSDKVSPLVSEEKLYVVNGRYSSLNNRHELTLFGSRNFNADSHIETQQGGGTYRYHINSDWSLGYRYSQYDNKLSEAGEDLFDKNAILPISDYAVKSSEGFINYNTVYGKIKLTEKTIVYFDHYVSLGYATMALGSGEVPSYIVDTGFAFWLGKHMSLRTGLKNELYSLKTFEGEKKNTQNMMGYLEFGYLFGEGSRI